jgi:Baseplate J-like protein
MATINVKDSRQAIDYLARDYESFRRALLDLIPKKLPEWTDRTEADFGIVLVELVSYLADILSYYQDRLANEAFLTTARERRSVLNHLRLIGYELAGAAPASARLSLRVHKDLTGTVEVRKGDQFATASSKEGRGLTFEYVDDKPLVIEVDNLPPSAREAGFKEAVDIIPVREGRTIDRDVLGVSDGSPNQRFRLSQPNVLRDTVQIVVETNPPTPTWRQRQHLVFSRRAFTPEELLALEYQDRIASTLAFSRGPDPDYALETDEHQITTVVFGDGRYGQIPAPGADVVARYRTGGTSAGNVGAGQINLIAAAPQLSAVAARVANRLPASGGADRESIEHAVRHAPTVFASMHRAVTASDYVAQALLFPGVYKARAVPLNWNTVVLYVAPRGTGEEPSDILKRDLRAFFEDKRMLTTQVDIQSPDYVRLEIQVEVGAKSYFRNVEVEAVARSTVEALFEFERADFGQTLYLSKLFEALEALDGVDFVVVQVFRRKSDPDPITANGRIQLGENEIALLAPADLKLRAIGGVVEDSA